MRGALAGAGDGGRRPLPAERGGDLPGPRGGPAGGGRRGACLSPPAWTPDAATPKTARRAATDSARGGCVSQRTQLQAPARPPGARPAEPAEPAGVGASKGPATNGTRAPRTTPTRLSSRHPRLPAPHGTPRSHTLTWHFPLRRTRRYPRGHPPPQSSAHPSLHRTPRSSTTEERASPPRGTPRASTHTPLPPAGANATLAPRSGPLAAP